MSGGPPSKRRALGRGLSALIPPAPAPAAAPPPASPGRKDYFVVPIEEVHPSTHQPRRSFDEERLTELARSISEEGLIQPLVVRERPPAEGGGFAIIAGERRWRAAQRAGLHDVPVVVREATPARAFELALVENVQRADLNPIEEAEAYQYLSDACGFTQEQIADRVGKDRSSVANSLRLLRLPPGVRELVQDGTLSMGHARALLGLEDAAAIEAAARKAVARGLTVRATEELVRREREGATRPPPPEKSATVRDLEQRLTRTLGARVKVVDRGGAKGGRLEIGYANLDDLDRLLDLLLGQGRS